MKKLILPAALLLSLTGFAQSTPTKLTLSKGQKLEVVTEMKRLQGVEAMGQNIETDISSTSTEHYIVDQADPNGAVITKQTKRLVTSMSNPMMGEQKFDSDNENDRKGDVGKQLAPMLSEVHTLSIDGTGKILSVKSNAEKKDSKDGDAMMSMMAGQIGSGAPEAGADLALKILPSRSLNVGDTWVDTSSKKGVRVSTNYKVNSITNEEVTLDYNQTININTTMNMMGQEGSIQNVETGVGQIVVDRASGLLKKRTATVDSKGTISVQGMEMPSTGKTTLTVTVKPVM